MSSIRNISHLYQTMNSLILPSSIHLNPSSITTNQLPCFAQKHTLNLRPHCSRSSLRTPRSSIGETAPPNEGQIPLIDFEDLSEKDWSFLESDDPISSIDRIIGAGEIEESSRVMASAPSEGFVDRLVDSSRCNLLVVVHDSLFVLAGIKEKHDKVKCWQGELVYVPEKWGLLDVLFLYFLPGLPFNLDQVLGAASKCCLPGSRVIISHPQGREVLEQQRKQYPDVVVSDLPEKSTLEKVAADHCFDLVQFVDEPSFYLGVLKYGGTRD